MARRNLWQRLHADQTGAVLVCLFSAAGALLSVFLTIAKFRSEYRCDAWLLTACSFWDWFDCNRVLDSYWATPFYRLPISVYATAYYFVLAGLAWAALSSPRRLLPVVRPLILWMAWAGLGVVAFLAFYAYVIVESACSYCVVIYGITLAIFLSASLMNPQGHRAGLLALFTPARSRGSVMLLVTLAFLALVSAQMVQYLRNANQVEFDRCMSEGGLPESDVGYRGQQPEAQISVFMDLACEFCRREYDVWRDFVVANPGRYRLAVYHYARAGTCVPPDFPWLSAKAEKNASCDAAQAIECVERELPGAGMRMVDALFELQGLEPPLFDYTRLGEAARKVGLTDVPTDDGLDHPFFECLRNHETAAFVQEHAIFAMDQGLRSTPVTYLTFFRKDGSSVPRMIHIKGAKQYGSIERTLAAARAAAEGRAQPPRKE